MNENLSFKCEDRKMRVKKFESENENKWEDGKMRVKWFEGEN